MNDDDYEPRAKGGFQDNPQNINRKGRPLKGYSITEMMKEMIAEEPKVREAIGKSVLKKALAGDTQAIKLIWQYMDGMPSQKIENTFNNEAEGVVLLREIISTRRKEKKPISE
jgi:hypothetical protein